MYTADIDVGGTFTDGFFTRGNEAQTTKVLTTPYDLTECFLNCLRQGAACFAIPLKDFLAQTLAVRLSTTLGTNTLIQRRGPRIGLLVTKGHEQDLYGRGEAAVLRLFLKPEMVRGIREEVDAQGLSSLGPDRAEVLGSVRALVDLGARMIAVSFAHSWRNPEHERAVRAIMRERYPAHYLRSIPLQLGHEVTPASDDHARTNTVVLNAYLHNELARGLYGAEERAREHGMMHPLLVVHGGGGCARVAKTVAVQTLGSGPAAATIGAATIARQLGLERVIAADMGGTSLDVALIINSRYDLDIEPEAEGIPLSNPMIRVDSLGAGGGSIARVVNGELRVGPESAGAVPGPVAYNKGGVHPTVTDANVILGYINPDYFLGGRMRLDVEKARRALEQRVGRLSGLAAEAAALAVRETINRTMADAIRERIHHRGLTPSQFTLFAFGGAGPLHACDVAAFLKIESVVAFPYGAVFGAFGSSSADVSHSYQCPLNGSVSADNLSLRLAELQRQALRDMRGEGFGEGKVRFSIDLVVVQDGTKVRKHFAGPTWIPIPADDTVRQWASRIIGFSRKEPVTYLILLAECNVFHWAPPFAAKKGSSPNAACKGERWVCWDKKGPKLTQIFERDRLCPGNRIRGPAIVEAPDTSYPVPPGWLSRMDNYGNLVFQRQA